MADPISIASGLLTLVMFGLKSSSSLYRTIKDFNSHQRSVRELREELEALNLVLTSLNSTVTATETESELDLTALKLPLLHCGNACNDFEAIIVNCTERSGGARTSFRDWARLKYMGEDINGFKNLLAGYKATITIALCDVNLRTSAVTTSVLNEYQEKIQDTMSDLNERLRMVDEKFQTLLGQEIVGTTDVERRSLRDERESIQNCLDICTAVSSHIDSVRPKVVTGIRSDDQVRPSTGGVGLSARQDTDRVLGRCKDDIADMLSQLNDSLTDVIRRQQTLSRRHPISGEQEAEQEKLQEEIDSIKQSLLICDRASKKAQSDRTNVFEGVSMDDDGHQVLVSTFGDLVFAKNVSAGARSTQWLGQMSDESLQRLSQARVSSSPNQALETELQPAPQFEGLYGRGRTCNS
ncbi:hypothetical protein B0J11DRAFT_534780 [Dendryphion nanum]|uniref:Azaphilone pigments biosynthesis cluster protein L N-terminal domain-containing protein n=1 Tax=Dendryphion nanum TaxID=256645 RepID=A0A9P9DIM0_9PLEO|nr:hypothetical protein B0J11DRAFT_534780 [Dendryphion nanum]